MVVAARSSFYWPMWLLKAPQRRGVMALYQLCRTLDDIADTPHQHPDETLKTLATWHEQIDALLTTGSSTHPQLAPLAPWVQNEALSSGAFDPLLRGLSMDVRGQMLAPPLALLEDYCFCVAGSVGLCAIRIMGDRSDDAARYALALGQALQRTNILRDVGEDLALGRLYLPAEVLAAHGIDPQALLHRPYRPESLLPVLRHVALQAEEYYEQSAALARAHLMPPCALMMGDIYARLHQQMRADHWQQQHYHLRRKDWWWLSGRLLHYQAA